MLRAAACLSIKQLSTIGPKDKTSWAASGRNNSDEWSEAQRAFLRASVQRRLFELPSRGRAKGRDANNSVSGYPTNRSSAEFLAKGRPRRGKCTWGCSVHSRYVASCDFLSRWLRTLGVIPTKLCLSSSLIPGHAGAFQALEAQTVSKALA